MGMYGRLQPESPARLWTQRKDPLTMSCFDVNFCVMANRKFLSPLWDGLSFTKAKSKKLADVLNDDYNQKIWR